MSNLNERICVIGAGMSGLTVSYYLQKKGYTNVTVLEKNGRVGGKCYTIKYKDKTYEMGTMMGVPSNNHVQELMKEFGIKNNGPLLYKGFFDKKGEFVHQIDKKEIEDFREQFAILPEILDSYKEIQEPGYSNLKDELCQPFSSWCKEMKIPVVEKVFAHAFTAFGFGYLDEIPAAYVLKFFDYKTLIAFIEITHLITWTEGIQDLLEKIANCLNDVRLTSKVVKIERKDDILVETCLETLHFDKIIITAPLDETLEYMDSTAMEKELFTKIEYEDFRVFSYKLEGIPPLTGYIPQNICRDRLGHIMVWYYRWGDRSSNDLINVYALSNPSIDNQTIRKRVEEDLLQMGAKINGLYMNCNWKHFPHVNSYVLKEGFYDKLENMQGEKNTYYAGEIMNFSSLEKCTQYSEYIVDKYF